MLATKLSGGESALGKSVFDESVYIVLLEAYPIFLLSWLMSHACRTCEWEELIVAHYASTYVLRIACLPLRSLSPACITR